MRYDQNNQLPYQRRRRDWISYLFPLSFLLIFVFTQSLAGLFTSLAIIVLLWALIAVDSSSPRRRNTAFMQPPLMQQPPPSPYEPEAQTPYEQGYLGVRNIGGPMAPNSSPTYPYQSIPRGQETSDEGDRLARLQQLGELYQAGILTEDEFTSQKKKILQNDAVKQATEPKETPDMEAESEYEQQMQLPYPQE